jgi:thiol-disulfide isomerase/thioredoxin
MRCSAGLVVLCGALVVAVAPVGARGQVGGEGKLPVTLKVGDAAPPLVVGEWVKGGPVGKLERGTVYVVEFWATWCGPCIFAMPHVTRMQAEYREKGVVVIGVSVWERDRRRVGPFVREAGGRIGYAVATDAVPAGTPDEPPEGGRGGRMSEGWLTAAGFDSVPVTFIVDRAGKVAWIGHPWRMDRPLRLIVEGTFDAAAEARTQEAAEAKRRADEQAVLALMADRGEGRAMDEALAVLDRLIAMDDGSLTAPILEAGGEPYGLVKLRALMTKADYAAASELAGKLVEALRADGGELRPVLNVMAWAPDLKRMDTDLMLRLAKESAAAAAKEDWKAQRMLASVHAARGEYDLAIAAQRRALAGASARDKPWEEARLKIIEIDRAEAKGVE